MHSLTNFPLRNKQQPKLEATEDISGSHTNTGQVQTLLQALTSKLQEVEGENTRLKALNHSLSISEKA